MKDLSQSRILIVDDAQAALFMAVTLTLLRTMARLYEDPAAKQSDDISVVASRWCPSPR